MSLPSRKCGLKSKQEEKEDARETSLPSRKCGLKYSQNPWYWNWGHVTSLAEVWIEMVLASSFLSSPDVTSLAEVWIEIRDKEDERA